jgi:hypothetical protein
MKHRRRHGYENYPPGWVELSARLREEAGQQCEVCFVREGPHGHPSGRRLAVDHVDGNTWNLARSNLIVLCSRCHMIKGNMSRARRFRDRNEVRLLLWARQERELAQLKLLEVS